MCLSVGVVQYFFVNVSNFNLLIHFVDINVKSYIVLEPERKSMHTFYFKFLPRENYKDNFGVKPKQILKYMQKSFIKLMLRAIRKSAAAKNTM